MSHHDAHLHALTNVPAKCQPFTTYRIPEPRKDFQTHGQYHKVKGQTKITSWCCPSTPPKQCSYQVSTFYTLRFPIYSPDKILEVKGQRSNKHHTMTLHTYTSNGCPYQVSTSYTLRFPRYRPDKILWVKVTVANFFPPPAHLDTMGENNTTAALKGCGVKTVKRYIWSLICTVCLQIYPYHYNHDP